MLLKSQIASPFCRATNTEIALRETVIFRINTDVLLDIFDLGRQSHSKHKSYCILHEGKKENLTSLCDEVED